MSLKVIAHDRPETLQAAYKNLSEAANILNSSSDKFRDAVSTLDDALNRLNPGVTAWVTVSRWVDEDDPSRTHEERLGFAKTNNRWGLSLCRVTQDNTDGEEETTDLWLFNDAPRNLRLQAIEHLPTLVEALAGEAERTAKRVIEGADFASQLAASISALADGKGNR